MLAPKGGIASIVTSAYSAAYSGSMAGDPTSPVLLSTVDSWAEDVSARFRYGSQFL